MTDNWKERERESEWKIGTLIRRSGFLHNRPCVNINDDYNALFYISDSDQSEDNFFSLELLIKKYQ